MSDDDKRPEIGKVYLNGVEIGSLCGPFIVTPTAWAFEQNRRMMLLMQRRMLDDAFGDTDPRLPEWP